MFFEEKSLIITLSYSLCLVVFILFYLVQELALNSRKQITFVNFKNKLNYFELKTNKTLLIIQLSYLLIGIVLVILFSLSNVTRIYLIVYLPVIFITKSLIYSNIKISKTNIDLSFFYNLYLQVQSNKEEKIRLEEKIIEFQKKEENLKSYCQDVINQLNGKMKITIPSYYFNKTLYNMTRAFNNLKDSLKNYNDNQINEFDKLLNIYLHTRVLNEYIIEPLICLSNDEFEKILNETEKGINDSLLSIILDSITSSAVNDIKSLIDLLNIVREKESLTEKYLLASLLYVSKQPEKDYFVKYLYDEKIINLDMILNIINKNNYFWIYNEKTFIYFDEQESAKILNSILTENAVDIAYSCLIHIDANIYSFIRKICDNTTINNDVRDIFEMFISLYTVSSGYNNEANMYENMAFSLLEYSTYKNDKNLNKVNEIITYGEFLENAEFIEINYKQALEDISDTVTGFIKILLTYGKSVCRNSSLVDYNKVISLFQEYRSNLNLKGIEAFTLLVKSLILVEENDSSIINTICATLESDANKYRLQITNFSPSKHIENGRKIIKYLNDLENETLIKILYRIEKTRLSYDRFIKL